MSRIGFDVDWNVLRAQSLAAVSVTVIDSGVDGRHPALADRVQAQWQREDAAQWIATDACPIDNDAYGHGTAVAGIICELAPNARIIDYPVTGQNVSGRGRSVLSALEAAIGGDGRLINMSLSLASRYRQSLLELCEEARRAGKVIVASQRNLPGPDDGHPAQLAACIGVGLHAHPSPFNLLYLDGHVIPLRARGEAVPAPVPGGRFAHYTGTSFATPTVTGLCALLLGRYPDLEYFELKTILKRIARRERPTAE